MFLVSCETPQKKQAKSMCSQIAYKKFPVKKVSYSCVQTIYKEVEKGEKCTTRRVPSTRFGERYELETVCKKITKNETRFYFVCAQYCKIYTCPIFAHCACHTAT